MALPAQDGTVQMLWDIEQIKQLKARYFRTLDTQDWDGFVGVFTEDCIHHLPPEAPSPTMGNAEYVAGLRRSFTDGVTVHHGHMPEISLVSDTEADGIWAGFDYVEMTSADGSRIALQGYGHYYETYRKGDDGQWRISSKRLERLRVDRLTAASAR